MRHSRVGVCGAVSSAAWVRLIIGIALPAVTAPYTLALNAASNQSRWPWGLDWFRRHSFVASAGFLVLMVIIAVLSEVLVRQASKGEIAGPAMQAMSNGDRSQATAVTASEVAITNVAGDYHVHPATNLAGTDGAELEAPPKVPVDAEVHREPELRPITDGSPLRILVYKASTVDAKWLHAVIDEVAARKAAGVPVELGHATPADIELARVDVLVLIYRATFHADEKNEVYGLAKMCRDRHRAAALIIAAADFSDQDDLTQQIRELLRDKGISQPFDLLVQQDLDAFCQWFPEQIETAVRMGTVGDRWVSQRAIADGLSGGDGSG